MPGAPRAASTALDPEAARAAALAALVRAAGERAAAPWRWPVPAATTIVRAALHDLLGTRVQLPRGQGRTPELLAVDLLWGERGTHPDIVAAHRAARAGVEGAA